MAKELFLLYSADDWHSTTSKQLLGIYSSKRLAILGAVTSGMKTKLSYDLDTQLQTQGESINYKIEIEILNLTKNGTRPRRV
jgi:hypothetical protein